MLEKFLQDHPSAASIITVIVVFLFAYGIMQGVHRVIDWQRKHEDKSWKNKD